MPDNPSTCTLGAMRSGRMVLAALLVALASCDRSDIDLYSCVDPDKGHKDAEGAPDPCHHHDLDAGTPGDAGETCDGVCVPGFPSNWIAPQLVWMGDEADAPPCPMVAPVEGFAARRPPAGSPCATSCACEPIGGSCALPATLTAASTSCPGAGSGVAHTSFDPPASWDGACTAVNAIPAGKLCGGVPCVQSVTVAPLTVKQSDCLAVETPNITPPPWGTFARACHDQLVPPRCVANGTVCAPAAPGPEFKQCITQSGDPAALDCPPAYPDRSIFYENFVDNRFCTPCACGTEEDGTCVGSIGLFSDAACGAPLIGEISIDALSPKCHDVPGGSALGSKSASKPIYTPGKCPKIGGDLGKIDAATTWTICCQGTP